MFGYIHTKITIACPYTQWLVLGLSKSFHRMLCQWGYLSEVGMDKLELTDNLHGRRDVFAALLSLKPKGSIDFIYNIDTSIFGGRH